MANITLASIEDTAAILELQKLAYLSEAQIYNDFSIPPLTQTLNEFQDEFAELIVLKAEADGRLVGSVRAWTEKGTCNIERLVVHPDYQGQGIGTRLMQEIEARFKDVRRFRLFTGHKSERNIRLYERLGYAVFTTREVTPALTFVFMEKIAPAKAEF